MIARRILCSRMFSRVFIVFGLLGLVAAWRLDQAVRTAYRTEWVAPQFVQRQERSLFGCADCWRLPSEPWLWAYSLTGSVAIVSLLIAALLFQRRHRSDETPAGVRSLAIGAGIFVVGIGIAEAIVRQLAARGGGNGLVAAATAMDLAALVILGILVIAAAAGSSSGPYKLVSRVARFLSRQRVNVLGLVLLTAGLIVVGQTSGQAIDSIRTWGFDSAHSIARLGFGISAVLLLSLVVYESSVQLTQVTSRPRKDTHLHAGVWFAIGGAFVAVGVVLVVTAPIGYGPIVIGAIVLLLGLLELPDLDPKKRETKADQEAEAKAEQGAKLEQRHDEPVAEVLAVVPLLLFAATGVAAAIDAALSRGAGHGLGPLVPTAILAVAAILMTAERQPRHFDVPGRKAWGAAVLLVVIGSILLVFVGSDVGAAVLALIACLAVLLYAGWLFHIQPPRSQPSTLCCPALSLAVAGAAGVGTLVAVHWDPFGSTNTLGTLTLVGFALAFWLTVLNLFVYYSFQIRPPRALRYIGVEQLPVVTLVAVAWIAAGAIRPPPTLHEARLTDRQSLVTTGGRETIPNAPTLSDAFAEWVRAQPELNGEAPSTSRAPVPMFLVAAHGGGIRAAYWTATALDCLVGVSSTGFEPEKLQAGDVPTRRATCESERRTEGEQQAAARRIFLASGVSGGGLGLYAYTRQLIGYGSLGEGGWVDERLGRDLASATVGWALFHDVPNNWLGLNSHRGGDCGWKIGSLCLTADRAAIHEEAFDRVWPDAGFAPLLRLTWDMRSSADKELRRIARTIPLLVINATVTGGKARGVVSAANLGTWPNLEAYDAGRGNFDTHPLAGTVEVVEAACATKDLRLSTAALLGGRFPYVSPSGHLSGQCRRSKEGPLEADKNSACAAVKASVCQMRLVDGGYADNSGLFSIDALWPSIRQLVMRFNGTSSRKIAPVIVELDNHYQAGLDAELSASGTGAESIVPLLTAFGARTSQETFARALAYRLRPPGCTVTISPGLHPGLTAPLGWELSKGAREDLRDGLIRPHPTALGGTRYRPMLDIRRLQQWLGPGGESGSDLAPRLEICIPTESFPQAG